MLTCFILKNRTVLIMYLHFMQIKVLLMAVKDFNPNCGDAAYTMGIVDLLLECVELSYRTGIRLIVFPYSLLFLSDCKSLEFSIGQKKFLHCKWSLSNLNLYLL